MVRFEALTEGLICRVVCLERERVSTGILDGCVEGLGIERLGINDSETDVGAGRRRLISAAMQGGQCHG